MSTRCYPALPALALLGLREIFPTHPDAPKWQEAVKLHLDKYILPISSRSSYQIMPIIRYRRGRAGGDAIRSLIISYKLLGTREWLVIHHTDCGMETFSDEIMRRLLGSSLKTAGFF